MSVITTSSEFHEQFESPIAFVRREWISLAVFGGGFVLVLLAAIVVIDPAFFYSRLSTDPLRYYLKGLAFVETGRTAARAAINAAPFSYVAFPGILRSPFMVMFHDFDWQWRAIQLSNVVLIAITGTLYAYVLSWALPRKYHRVAIAFVFATMILTPEWVANVLQPLADLPYALFTVSCIVVAARFLRSGPSPTSRAVALAGATVLFLAAFLTRFTAPLLLLYCGILAAGLIARRGYSRRVLVAPAASAAAFLLVIVVLNWETIRSRYLHDQYQYWRLAKKSAMVLNLVGVSLPSQILPAFRLGYREYPVLDTFSLYYTTTSRDVAVFLVGVIISALVFFGMWRSRKKLMPEIAYVLGALPIITPLMQSTTRYLMTYQPLLWIFAYSGAAGVLAPVFAHINVRTRRLIAVSTLVLMGVGVVAMRSSNFVETVASAGGGVPLRSTRQYVSEVVIVFRSLRSFLEGLPRERTLLISQRGSEGRWRAISGLNYYHPDSALAAAAAERDLYLVSECGTFEACTEFERWDRRLREQIEKYGSFDFSPEFSRATDRAKVRVYRVRNRQSPQLP